MVAQAIDFSAALETQRDEPEGVIFEADVQRATLILVSSADEASRMKDPRLEHREFRETVPEVSLDPQHKTSQNSCARKLIALKVWAASH